MPVKNLVDLAMLVFGSKYLKGVITENDFQNIISQDDNPITLQEATCYASSYLMSKIADIKQVDKIFEEVDYSLEAHIEQYDLLQKKAKKLFFFDKETIGIINSVGSAVRVKYHVKGKSGHTGSTPMRKRKNAVDATSFIGLSVSKLGRKYERKGLGRASQVEVNTINHNGSFNQIPEQAEGLIDFRLLGENKPDKVLKDFKRVVRRAKFKTGTKIGYTIVSKGAPVITSASLNSGLEAICKQKNIQYKIMPSFAGQDTGYIPAKEKTMIFIPSTGGSHNAKENTNSKYITSATKIFTDFSKTLLPEKLKDRIRISPSSSQMGGFPHTHELDTISYQRSN